MSNNFNNFERSMYYNRQYVVNSNFINNGGQKNLQAKYSHQGSQQNSQMYSFPQNVQMNNNQHLRKTLNPSLQNQQNIQNVPSSLVQKNDPPNNLFQDAGSQMHNSQIYMNHQQKTRSTCNCSRRR